MANTLMETLVTLTLMMILSVGGLYGWQRWQQQHDQVNRRPGGFSALSAR